MNIVRTLAIAAALFAMSATASPAQQTGAPSGQGYMMGSWMMGQNGMMGTAVPSMMGQNGAMPMMGWNGQGASMCSAMAGHVEGRLAYLKTELKITAAQTSLWNAYAAAARENAQSMFAHCTAMTSQAGPAALNLLDRLDLHEQFIAAQLDALRAMNKTLKPLYATLDDNQKQAADQFFWGPMGMM